MTTEAESVWDIVTAEKTEVGKNSYNGKKITTLHRIISMKRNCEPEVVDIIGQSRNANDAYKELRAKYEGKTVTDLGAILANVVRLMYDDRNSTIEEHVTEFANLDLCP